MNKIYSLIYLLFFAISVKAQEPSLLGLFQPRKDTISKPLLRVLSDKQLIEDPKTKSIPQNMLLQSMQQVQSLLSANATIPGVTWVERGPNNIGGRTRALMFDPNDGTEKKVWAGGVSGGLWYNNDITLSTSSWTKINDFWDNLAISAIDFDPSNTSIFYAGTGEGYYNIDAVGGGGIWKTIDGGVNWTLLASTIPDFSSGASTLQSSFRYVQDLVVLSNGNVIVATRDGILRSTDGGLTWSIVLSGVNAGDLERCSDNVIFAGINGGKIYKSSNNGVSWTDITPGIISGGGRTELGVAFSTSGSSQIIYASAAASNGQAWFIKSSDGGTSWSTLTVPNFVGTQGWYDFIIQVHPTNTNLVVCGGTNFVRTTDGGATWSVHSYSSHGHPDMHEIKFRKTAPNEAIYGNDGGVYYVTDFGNASATFPTSNFSSRNKNYNVTQYYAAAQKNITGDEYVIAGAQDNGTHKITTTGVGAGTSVMGGDGMLCFIDQDEPHIQIGSYQQNYYNLLNETGATVATLINDNDGSFINPADYDWKNNILYTYKNTTQLVKVAGVGTTNTKSYINFGTTLGAGVIKVAYADNTLFRASGATIYKVTNLDTTPVLTNITSGSSISGTISCIELGDTDNEILVTTSSYNVKNVWYTTNGGSTWTSKDETTYGLPNIPVRFAIFNPKNRNQVMLATELGVWSTNSFLSANPGWEISSTNLAKVRCDMLRYRSSDGRVVVGTHGRGVFISDVFSSSITPEIVITSKLKSSYCSGEELKVAFIASGTFNAGNIFTLQLSDASGSFTSPTTLGTTSVSPFSVAIIPSNQAASTNYKLRVVSSDVSQNGTQIPISIAAGSVNYASNLPNSKYGVEKTVMLNAETTQNAELNYVLLAKDAASPSRSNISQGKNSEGFSAIKSGVIATTANVYTGEILSGLMIGKEFDVFIASKDIATNCFNPTALKISAATSGTPLTYLTPTYSSGCNTYNMYINSFVLNGTVISNQDACPNASSFDNKQSAAISLSVGTAINFYANLTFNGGYYYTPSGQGMKIWVDINQDGVFDNSEVYYSGAASPTHSSTITIPTTALPGLTTMRIRTEYNATPASPTASITYGEAEDHLINIINNTSNNRIYSDINIDSVNVSGTLKIYYSAVGAYDPSNTFAFELSDASGSFASPINLQSSYVGTSPISVIIPPSTVPGNGYIIRAKASNPALTGFISYPFKIVNNCPNNLTVAANSTNVTTTFKAENNITSAKEITGTSNIIFRSNSINLAPGFIADSGVVFKTEIGGCN